VGIDYKKAGVDVERGDEFVDWIQSGDQSTGPFAKQLISGVGGFAAIFRLPFLQTMKNPCLVSSTDGVGTKVKLAAQFAQYRGVGQDLVAMCVNDLICCGAQPLFFLDYYASGMLDLVAAKEFLSGVRDACHKSGCSLIGGETAEMPGVYQPPDFDCAGFAVGIVDESKILGAARVKPGSVAIGVESSGFHSNGYSLLRKLFADDLKEFKDQLLIPTHLYPSLVLALAAEERLQAVAHITGGGMENIPRVMPKGTELELLDWAWPECFIEVQDRSGLSRTEMLQTLNCGIGLVLFADRSQVSAIEAECAKQGFCTSILGEVSEAADAFADPRVVY
jgi:phosphoribosylformylglycinamidine cyclo-ligase